MENHNEIVLFLESLFSEFKPVKESSAVLDIMHKLANLIEKVQSSTDPSFDAPNVVHNALSEILSDVEGVVDVEGVKLHSFLPFAELLAVFIELFTHHLVEVSTIQDDGEIFCQIDEKNEFYFSFFDDHLEFAFGNFNNFYSASSDEVFKCKDICSKLKEFGASDEIVNAWKCCYRVFLYVFVNGL